jgi:phosphoribosyl-ATP pyrophosphohydrolase
MKFQEIYKIIANDISRDKKSLAEIIVKLQEESGEIAASYLMARGKKNRKLKTKEEIELNFIEECCDSLIVLMCLLARKKVSREKFNKMIDLKLEKWKRKLK